MTTTILGIDSAWTQKNKSGIACLKGTKSNWSLIRSESIYLKNHSIGAIKDAIKDWDVEPNLLSVDLPISKEPITRRRHSDQEISKKFGEFQCSAHSPNGDRPGKISDEFMKCLMGGYRLATKGMAFENHDIIETYPHAALVRMLKLKTRLQYKVARRSKYWPKKGHIERKELLIANFKKIADYLAEFGVKIDFALPTVEDTCPKFKEAEDRLDAIICAWVGALYIEGRCDPFGDDESTIWVPSAS